MCSCDSISDNSSRARSRPALPVLGLFERSLSTRRSAASTRSRARSRSTRVYWRSFGRVRFFRGDTRAPNARRMAFRLTPVEFFVMSLSLHAPRSRQRVAQHKHFASSRFSLAPAIPITDLWNVRLPGHSPLARVGILLGQRRQRQDETPDNRSRQDNGPEGFKDRDCPEWFLVLVKKVLIRHRNLHSQSSRRQWVLHRAFASSPHCLRWTLISAWTTHASGM